ncbi:MAG: hypothetical protein IPL15_10175 [Comamonadaceae bacterium]|uniref:hypothetical protein n=1 Tax=Candidatus Skiveiella danica TaxID=3386177 RepID=UPI00390A27A7|nr:hypothetical protein [Comamonadaceae bacterium]
MPRNLAEHGSGLTAVEIDRVPPASSRRSTRPAASMCGFPLSRKLLPDHWFDLVIGSLPFGKYKVADVSNRALPLRIHNCFFGRALDLVRPVGCCLHYQQPHSGCQYETVRVHRKSGSLLGAIRLPKGRFAGSRLRGSDRHPVPAQAAMAGRGGQEPNG